MHPGSRRDVAVNECNVPLATWTKAVLVVPKKQGLAFVVVEREDGSRSGETAPGRSRGRRQQQRRGRRTKPLASSVILLTTSCLSWPRLEKHNRSGSALSLPVAHNQTPAPASSNISTNWSWAASVLASLVLAARLTSANCWLALL